MTMLAIRLSTGGVALMTLIGDADAQTAIEQWKEVNPDLYVNHYPFDSSKVPEDYTHRDAWRLSEDGQSIAVDPAAAAALLVPRVVSARAGKEALLDADLLDRVQPAISEITDVKARRRLQIYWDESTEFQRNHPHLIAMAQAIGLTDEQVDALFIAAAAL